MHTRTLISHKIIYRESLATLKAQTQNDVNAMPCAIFKSIIFHLFYYEFKRNVYFIMKYYDISDITINFKIIWLLISVNMFNRNSSKDSYLKCTSVSTNQSYTSFDLLFSYNTHKKRHNVSSIK